MRSVAGDVEGNRNAVAFLCEQFASMGFRVEVAGATVLEQPVVVAHRPASGGNRRLLIYGHYDVVSADDGNLWQSDDPWVPEIIGKRVYARGIADNKGPLLMRLLAIERLVANNEDLPEILWLVHGSEEAETPCPKTQTIFAERLSAYPADLYMEETGFNDITNDEPILLLWKPSGQPVSTTEANNLQALANCDRIQQRPLNKINRGRDCPFLNALPNDAIYIGFGPNDRQHRIHNNDESLDLSRLLRHHLNFMQFVRDYGGA